MKGSQERRSISYLWPFLCGTIRKEPDGRVTARLFQIMPLLFCALPFGELWRLHAGLLPDVVVKQTGT
ncbi:MAG TPA: hypothetical protein VF421_04585 [Niabella sp.]